MPGETISVEVEFFAQFREDRGLASERLDTHSRTAAELYTELDARHHFRIDRAKTRVAVNDALAPWDTVIRDGDTIVFLSPFGGG